MQAKRSKENHTLFKPQFLHLLNKIVNAQTAFSYQSTLSFVRLRAFNLCSFMLCLWVRDSTQGAESMSPLSSNPLFPLFYVFKCTNLLSPHNTIKNILFLSQFISHLRRLLDPNHSYVNDVKLNLNLSILAPRIHVLFFKLNFIIVILQCCVNFCSTAK